MRQQCTFVLKSLCLFFVQLNLPHRVPLLPFLSTLYQRSITYTLHSYNTKSLVIVHVMPKARTLDLHPLKKVPHDNPDQSDRDAGDAEDAGVQREDG